jgi:hypothetical protein
MKRMGASAVVGALLLAAAGMAGGAEPEGWEAEITPYLWLVGLSGDVTVRGQKIHFDRSTSDILADAKVAGSALSVVQYDRFLFWGQVDYYSISTSKMDVKDRPQGGTLDTDVVLGEAALGYQIDGWKEGQTFDLLLGLRAMHLKHDLEVYGYGSYQNDSNAFDPILVVRPFLPLFPSKIRGLALNPTLAIGGGGDSDLVYELYVQLQYQISEYVVGRLGYRTVGYQVSGDRDGNKLDCRLAGLMVGLGVTF